MAATERVRADGVSEVERDREERCLDKKCRRALQVAATERVRADGVSEVERGDGTRKSDASGEDCVAASARIG